jgi:hypothetical protein
MIACGFSWLNLLIASLVLLKHSKVILAFASAFSKTHRIDLSSSKTQT